MPWQVGRTGLALADLEMIVNLRQGPTGQVCVAEVANGTAACLPDRHLEAVGGTVGGEERGNLIGDGGARAVAGQQDIDVEFRQFD